MNAMTIAEFAAAIRLPRSTTYKIVARGEVEVINVGTGERPRLRITPAAVEAYLESRRLSPAPTRGAR